MGTWKSFLQRKNVVVSARRYGVDALGAMAQGLFASLLIGTILDTLGGQLGAAWLGSFLVYQLGSLVLRVIGC